MINYYNRMKTIVLDNIPKTPDVITEEWLNESLKNTYFAIWGFTFDDLSNTKFLDNISNDTLRRISYSTKTIFNNNSPIKINLKMLEGSKEYKALHEEGINGEGINVAIIDHGFSLIHDELKGRLQNEVTTNKGRNFHGLVDASIFVGNNIGICPKANLYYFELPCKGDNQRLLLLSMMETTIDALKKIYELNSKGANIRVVSISVIQHRASKEFEEIENKLKSQGCYVIDCKTFMDNFRQVNKDYYTEELYFNKDNYDEDNSKIAVYNNTPLIPLYETSNDYVYGGVGSNSMSIPVLSGLFTLCLQVNKNLTYDEFVELANKTRIEKNDGIKVINPIGIIEEVKHTKNKTI